MLALPFLLSFVHHLLSTSREVFAPHMIYCYAFTFLSSSSSHHNIPRLVPLFSLTPSLLATFCFGQALERRSADTSGSSGSGGGGGGSLGMAAIMGSSRGVGGGGEGDTDMVRQSRRIHLDSVGLSLRELVDRDHPPLPPSLRSLFHGLLSLLQAV